MYAHDAPDSQVVSTTIDAPDSQVVSTTIEYHFHFM